MRPLEAALESPANTAPAVLLDHGIRVVGGRSPAFWRGSSDLNVTVYPDRIVHHAGAYRVPRILTELLGYSEDEARRYLQGRAGLSDVDAPPVYRQFTAGIVPQKDLKGAEKPVKADGALKRWETLSTTGSSPYLERKGVQGAAAACGAIRYGRGSIAVRMSRITEAGALEPVSVQTIYHDGGKRFAAGGSTRGAVALVGATDPAAALASGHVWLAEGLATALTVHAATGGPVLTCFSAGTIRPAVKALRRLEPSGKKLRITVAADDDRFNKPEAGNAGLEKAHRAALVHGARVAAPTFRSSDGQPTDFNDLHGLEGLGAVRAQLAGARSPDPALAFAADRRKRDKWAASATRGRYLGALELRGGVTTLRAPHGVGKTEALKPHITDELTAGGRVLYVTPSASLTEEAARRLGLESYADALHRPHLHLVPGLAVCLNSLPRLLNDRGELHAPDLLVLDESEQLVRTLTGAHVAQRERVLEALLLLIQRARRVVCLDADLGKLTRTLLTEARPRERQRRLEHLHPVGEGRTLRVHAARDDLYAALDVALSPALVLTNSKAEAEALGAHLRGRGRRVRVLTGEHDEGDAAFMADLEGSARAEGLEALVCSPTLRTGVSLTGGYFGHVFGVFHAAVGTPEDALQALWRVRTPARYDLWIDPRTAREHIDLAARYSATREHEAAALGRRVGLESATYRTIKHAVEATAARARSAYRLDFLRLAALQGFAFELLEHDPDHTGLATSARARADAERYGAVNTQRPRVLGWGDDAEAKADELAARRFLGRDDRAALECYRVTTFYRVGPEDDLVRVLELDHRGRYRRQLGRLELTLAPVDAVQGAVDELLKERAFADDIPALASRRLFYRQVLGAASFGPAAQTVLKGDASQLELPRYDAEALEPLREWIEENRSWLAGIVALPAADKLRANLIRYVGGWLKAVGLKQKRTGKNEFGVYSLELQTLETACCTMQKRGTLSSIDTLKGESVPVVPELPAQPSRALERPPGDPAAVPAWLRGLLNSGRLAVFGAARVSAVRQKLDENAAAWLHRFAHSRDLGRVLGAV